MARKSSIPARIVSKVREEHIDFLKGLPPAIMSLLLRHAAAKGERLQDYIDIFCEIAIEVRASHILDYISVVDVTIATFEIMYLNDIKYNVIERKRDER